MIQYIIKRLLLMIPTLVGITLITFLIMKLAPGDPVSLKLMFAGQGLSPEGLAKELAKKEDPIPLPAWLVRLAEGQNGERKGSKTEKAITWTGKNTILYGKWLKNIVKLDFGYSAKDKRPVLSRILEAIPITLAINIISICIVYFISIPLGVWSALHRDTTMDKLVMIKLFILYSLPSFWVATLLLVYLAGGEYLNLFPMMGYESASISELGFGAWIINVAWHLVLPIIASTYEGFAFLSRFERANFLEVMKQDYIRTARAKGLSETQVIWKHIFRNSLIPLVTLMGSLLPALLGGSVIIEEIFSIPGMGMLSFEAVLGRDYNVIMGITTISAFLTLLSLLLSDILYMFVDPRISFEGK
ncbi:ABC transporter permease [bacterium]|nr:ABC transporter permease [bacterium]